MYLHELGEEVDSFTKEDMAQGPPIFFSSLLISHIRAGKHLLSIHAIDQETRSDVPEVRRATSQPTPTLRASQPLPVRAKPGAPPAVRLSLRSTHLCLFC